MSQQASPPPSNNQRTAIPVHNVTGPQILETASNQGQFQSFDLIAKLDSATADSASLDQLLLALSEIMKTNTDCLAIWIAQREDLEGPAATKRFGRVHSVTQEESQALWPIVEQTAQAMMVASAQSRSIKIASFQRQKKSQLITAPVLTAHNSETNDPAELEPVQLVVCACFSLESESTVRQQWMMGMVSTSIAQWSHQQLVTQSTSKIKSLNDALGLVQALDGTTSVKAAALTVVNHLKRITGVQQVSLSYCQRAGKGKLLAVSDVERVDLTSESNRVINSACNQSISSQELVVFPEATEEVNPNALALEKYCRSNHLTSAVNIPLTDDQGNVFGALLFGADDEKLARPQFQEYLGRLTPMVAGHMKVVLRANRGLRDVAKHRIAGLRNKKWTIPTLAGLCCLIGAMLIPWPYRVGCDCEVQPVMRRYIAAPYDGILEKTLVAGGDIVKKDELLATLDGRSLRIELAGAKAEYDGAKKRRDAALARRDVAQSQIAKSEMARHKSRIELLDNQLVNLEVRSPIDGIIVSGDLEKVEGAPLEMGKTLFEVGPLDHMLAEVGIPESEIQYVTEGMDVCIKLNAFPFKTWTGTIERIHPSTEVVNDQAVFVAQVKLPNEGAELRPGMQGSAKVTAASKPIGWNLFHRAWERVRYWTIW